MIGKLYVMLFSLLFVPQTQVLSIKQADDVLSTSVLLRVKQWAPDPETGKIKRSLAGCSGTYISPDRVLTAAHCFSSPVTDVWVRDRHVRWGFRARLLKIDPERDLALLEVKNVLNHPYARLAKRVRVGEQVINVGSPIIFEFLVSEGIVAATGHKDRTFKSRYTITTAMINPGSSGGGAFNASGELIGVNTMAVGIFGWSGISMAVDTESIRGFLNGTL